MGQSLEMPECFDYWSRTKKDVKILKSLVKKLNLTRVEYDEIANDWNINNSYKNDLGNILSINLQKKVYCRYHVDMQKILPHQLPTISKPTNVPNMIKDIVIYALEGDKNDHK